jgi:hypothetical protein
MTAPESFEDAHVAVAPKSLPPVLDEPAKDGVNAYVCEGVTCLEPVDYIAALYALLGADSNAGSAYNLASL